MLSNLIWLASGLALGVLLGVWVTAHWYLWRLRSINNSLRDLQERSNKRDEALKEWREASAAISRACNGRSLDEHHQAH